MTKANILDLHGVKHEEVDRIVENFVLLNQNLLPLHVICGNSNRMLELAKQTLERVGVEYVTSPQYGKLTIIKI